MKKTIDDFINKAEKVHGKKYDYSKVIYKNCKEKVCIVCPEHGEFWQTPDAHVQGRGCPVCRYISSAKNNSLTTGEFIKKAIQTHKDKYDYSKVVYKNQKTPVCIICHVKDENGKEHGEFWQYPTGHIDKKAGCPRCSKNHKYTTEEFIQELPLWVKEKYDFSKFVYKRTHEKAIVICPEHGEFLMSPHNLRKGIGCPRCNESKLERNIRLFLTQENIEYIPQYKTDSDFGKQTLDFFLPKYSIGIECQGRQHFVPADFGGKGEEWAKNQLERIKELDLKKQQLCKNKGITLIYYTTEENLKMNCDKKLYENYQIVTNIKDLTGLITG